MVEIKKMYLITTRGYNDIYRRSYNLHTTPDTLTKLENLMNNPNAVTSTGELNELALANELPNIMTMSDRTSGNVAIANGWNTVRLAFIMEVDAIIDGSVLTSYIQGYSEYHDPSISGMIDPEVVFHINSINTVTKMVDPITGQWVSRPYKNFNIIKDSFGNSSYEEVVDTELKLIRPSDVMANIQNTIAFDNDLSNVRNYTDNIVGSVNTSSRGNNNPMKHFATTVNGYLIGKNLTAIGYNDDSDVYRMAGVQVSDASLSSVPFLTELYKLTGVPSPTTFTMNILSKMDMNIANKVTLIERDDTIVKNNYTALDSENTEVTYKPTIESIIATNILHTLNDLLVENLLLEVALGCTNITGVPVTAVSNVKSFITGIDVTSYINKVVTNIEHMLMPTITRNGLLVVDFMVDSNILLDTTISISVNNQPPVLFRFPTFADSLYVPVITTEEHSGMISRDMGLVLDAVTTYNSTNESMATAVEYY